MDLIGKYFPDLPAEVMEKLAALPALYAEWNSKINVVSRKDMDNFVEHHLLHCLAISKALYFSKGAEVIDAGSGGGLPGVPLAVVFPEVQFTMVDSTAKKLRVVEEISSALGLQNVSTKHARLEELSQQVDYVTARAVTRLAALWQLTQHLIRPGKAGSLSNGLLTLKGGDLSEEWAELRQKDGLEYALSQWYQEPFFQTKKLLWVPKYKG